MRAADRWAGMVWRRPPPGSYEAQAERLADARRECGRAIVSQAQHDLDSPTWRIVGLAAGALFVLFIVTLRLVLV